ncbi:MAG: hypothetical protein DMD35_14750 [Gemmatimonadetes bacterium]|nr:MAG: hypothetical protein DMD35_14750 [Gemmatimonadota bacterium]
MPQRPSRSLKYEYELYVEREIENYKESVPRSVLLSIGDEAVRALADEQQFALTELLLCDEVDRIIFKRLRLPSYTTWRKRRIRLIEELRRPEHWGLSPDDFVVRAVQRVSAESRVLVAGVWDENRALLYLAAQGCDVTAFANADDVQRVLDAAEAAGLAERVRATSNGLGTWTPEAPLSAVMYTPAAFAGLGAAERARVIEVLQCATADGGVHLVQTIAASKRAPVSLDELRRRYEGWDVTVEEGGSSTFVARKALA